MKKKLFTLLAVICSMFGLTSCDPDVTESMTLSGEWYGDFGMYYEYQYGRDIYHFDSYDTDIEFVPSYFMATHGYGYQVDWYRRGPYEYLSYRFEWWVKDGNIYLHYPYSEEWDAVIYRYSLSDYYFTGFFNEGGSRFSLRKMEQPYNWEPYYNRDFGYGAYSGWDYYPYSYYYAPGQKQEFQTRGTFNTTDSVNVAKIIRRGNRYLDAAEK